ncbi:MAG: bifunctional diaminohydroxyphosphoribosylaminopyrimidine deaminase/5-amino-6-(5-phosphoribosylamino)uracil reductase RibD [Deltaproteobacteria bacterium]|nr:bifunctional diaminohydroxyphosphoribosylaminopyrimidine deaminase/5-amino-6-(5-phosphoribosylamino)uracil reductase RibD [Deltaproteobacteria bacterium]
MTAVSTPFPSMEFMRMAIRLARKGVGRTSPNPAVGAVLVRGGKVVGRGYHRAAGMPHAEVEAIRDAGAAARGADLYVTLEPCCHAGRTGPCTETILSSGVRRVAAAMSDPNPLVAGKGLSALRKAGLTVVDGLLGEEARALNLSYLKWIVSGKPYVTLKMAVTLDGQIAAAGGDSRWVSCEKSRAVVHRMRSAADAVLVGGETFRRDDPRLTSRVQGGRNPVRVILTSSLSGVSGSRIFRGGKGKVVFACPRGVPERDVRRAVSLGAKVIRLPSRAGRIPASVFLRALGKEGIVSLLVEGGGKTAGWLAAAGAVDRYVFFVAPLLLGEGVRAFVGYRARKVAGGRRLEITGVRRVGDDLMVTAEPPQVRRIRTAGG